MNGKKKQGGRWNWKENKEGDNVDKNKKTNNKQNKHRR